MAECAENVRGDHGTGGALIFTSLHFTLLYFFLLRGQRIHMVQKTHGFQNDGA